MNDSLYFLFLDEIYAPNLNDLRSFSKTKIFSHLNHLHFGISGVYLPASCLNDLYLASRRIKQRYYPKAKNLIFHSVDILNDRNSFADLAKNSIKSKSFKASLNSLIQNTPFHYDCVFVDKHELIKKYGIFDQQQRVVKIAKIGSNLFPRSHFIDYNLYLLCLRKLVIDFTNYLCDKKVNARGIILAEARGEREDTELREAFYKIYDFGVGKLTPKNLRNIILDLFIVPKTQNYIGTQMADLVLYPTYDAKVPLHGTRKDHFINFDKVLRRKLKNGVTVIP